MIYDTTPDTHAQSDAEKRTWWAGGHRCAGVLRGHGDQAPQRRRGAEEQGRPGTREPGKRGTGDTEMGRQGDTGTRSEGVRPFGSSTVRLDGLAETQRHWSAISDFESNQRDRTQGTTRQAPVVLDGGFQMLYSLR